MKSIAARTAMTCHQRMSYTEMKGPLDHANLYIAYP